MSKCVNLSDWKKLAKAQQENFCNQLGDRIWDRFDLPAHDVLLFKKIALPLFGNPKPELDDMGLNAEQIELVNDIKEKCKIYTKFGETIYIGVIFIHVYLSEEIQTVVPLYRIRTNDSEKFDTIDQSTFIDHLGRVYMSWYAYRNENMWNQSWLCGPKSGYYWYDKDYVFYDQSDRGYWTEIADTTSTYVGIASTIGMLSGLALTFFPPTAPIGAITCAISGAAGAPGAVYGAGRSVAGLIDRAQHDQSISLGDSTARMQWLTTVTSIIAVGTLASAQVLANTAKTGELVSSTTRSLCTTLNVTAVSISGIGVLNSVYEVSNKEKVTAFDVFQLTTSIFFFTHSVVSFKTASTIIKDAQNETIANMRNGLSPENQVKHDAILQGSKESVKPGQVHEMHGNAKFIREMIQINNKNEFYSNFQIQANGQMNINNELKIHPRAFLQMSETDRATLLNLSKQLEQGQITMKQFNAQAVPIQKEYRIRMERHRTEAKQYLQQKMTNIQIGEQSVGNLAPRDLDRLESVVKTSLKGDVDIIDVADQFANKLGANSVSEWSAAGEYAARKLDAEIEVRRAENPNPLREPKLKAKEFYKREIIKEWKADETKFQQMSDNFNELRQQCDAANVGAHRFGNSMAAANHYDKHGKFPVIDQINNLSPEAYFSIASEMCSEEPKDVKWTQDGSSLKMTFESERYGATAIRFENLSDKKSVIATLYAKDIQPISQYHMNN